MPMFVPLLGPRWTLRGHVRGRRLEIAWQLDLRGLAVDVLWCARTAADYRRGFSPRNLRLRRYCTDAA